MMIQRTSCVVCDADQLYERIKHLNSNGWVVTSFRETTRINELALQAIHIGSMAAEAQRRIEVKWLK